MSVASTVYVVYREADDHTEMLTVYATEDEAQQRVDLLIASQKPPSRWFFDWEAVQYGS